MINMTTNDHHATINSSPSSSSSSSAASTTTSFCESLFGLLLPSLYASIRLGGLNSFQELIMRLNHSATMTNWPYAWSNANNTSANPNYVSSTMSAFDYFNRLVTHPCDQYSIYRPNLTPPNDSYSSSSLPITTTTVTPLMPPLPGVDLPPPVRCTLIYNYTLDLANYFQLCNQIESNLVYFEWLLGLFTPLIYALCLMFLLPSVVVLLLYASSLFMFLTKHWNKLKNTYYSNDLWQASFKSLAVFWETQGAIWHGHEVVGLENIPDTGPGLLIYYHAAMPIDMYYLHSKVVLYKNRRMKIVADRFLFKVPGLGSLLEAFEVTPGSVDSCVSLLKQGHVLTISPGGVREALFSDHNYEIIWGSRDGFSRVATEAKVPVIPMFTRNSREALRTLPFFKKFFRFVYEKTRLPLVPIYGMFPVKLITYIGKPIEYDESRTPEELKELTKQRIEELIKQHQRLPGSILHALLDRFRWKASSGSKSSVTSSSSSIDGKKSH